MKSFWSMLLALILSASIGLGILFGVKYKDNIKEYFSKSSSSLEDSSASSEDNSSSSSSSSSSSEEVLDYKTLYEEQLGLNNTLSSEKATLEEQLSVFEGVEIVSGYTLDGSYYEIGTDTYASLEGSLGSYDYYYFSNIECFVEDGFIDCFLLSGNFVTINGKTFFYDNAQIDCSNYKWSCSYSYYKTLDTLETNCFDDAKTSVDDISVYSNYRNFNYTSHNVILEVDEINQTVNITADILFSCIKNSSEF